MNILVYQAWRIFAGFVTPMFESTPPGFNGWAVRAGLATPISLQAGFVQHRRAPEIYGCSVQYHPTLAVPALAQAGSFPHRTISYAREADLRGAAHTAGYAVYFVKTPGTGYHFTLIAYRRGKVQPLLVLPDDLAQALSVTVQRMPNPFPRP